MAGSQDRAREPRGTPGRGRERGETKGGRNTYYTCPGTKSNPSIYYVCRSERFRRGKWNASAALTNFPHSLSISGSLEFISLPPSFRAAPFLGLGGNRDCAQYSMREGGKKSQSTVNFFSNKAWLGVCGWRQMGLDGRGRGGGGRGGEKAMRPRVVHSTTTATEWQCVLQQRLQSERWCGLQKRLLRERKMYMDAYLSDLRQSVTRADTTATSY